MHELKLTIAKNIAELRKQHDMTQIQLAERLNYSDKAISKWERGESLPDITVLIEIAKLFSVSLDYIVSEEHSSEDVRNKVEIDDLHPKTVKNNHRAITGISIQAVWLVAMLCFIPLALVFPESDAKWLCFIYTVPISAIVWLVFNSIWLNRRRNYFIISILMWTVLASIHITVLFFGAQWHLIYLLGAPGELIIILWSVIAKNPSKKP